MKSFSQCRLGPSPSLYRVRGVQIMRESLRTNDILIIKINAQHNALSKAIKTRFKIESIYYVTFRLNLRHLQTSGLILHTEFEYISMLIVLYLQGVKLQGTIR